MQLAPKTAASTASGRPALNRYSVALAAVILALGLRTTFGEDFSHEHPFVLCLFAVIVASGYGGLLPGLLTAGLSVIAVSWLSGAIPPLSPPYDPRYWQRVLSFAAVSLVISVFINWLLKANQRLRASAKALEEANARLKTSEQELKLANLRLKNSETELTEANRLLKYSNEELETFAYAVSHDLQAPLRTVAALSEMVAERHKGRLDADTDELLGHISAGVKRMAKLVSDLLDYSKASRPEPSNAVTTDGNAVFAAVLRDHHSAISEHGATVICTGLPMLRMDPRRLHQVLSNLVGNAIKYRSANSPEIQVDARPDGDRWILTVKDNGIGFDGKHAERIFHPFERLHSSADYDGSGIGLAIVKRVVDQEGGRVWAESSPGEGSTFFVSLPRAAGEVPSVPAESPRTSAVTASK